MGVRDMPRGNGPVPSHTSVRKENNKLNILVSGTRTYNNKELIRKLIEYYTSPQFGDKFLVINGAARGADRLSTEVAKELGVPWKEYPADWDRYKNGAGPLRNKQMLAEAKPDLLLAFVDDPVSSSGTANMILQAIFAGISIEIYSERLVDAIAIN